MDTIDHLHALRAVLRRRRLQMLEICSHNEDITHDDFKEAQAMARAFDVALLDIATQITKALGPASTAQAA